MKKVIVSGGRNYSDKTHVFRVLLGLLPIDLIIQGGANGADKLAREFALEHGIACQTFEADWDTHGKSAGPRRNASMCEKNKDATAVFFPGGRGTDNCHMNAKRLGLTIVDAR